MEKELKSQDELLEEYFDYGNRRSITETLKQESKNIKENFSLQTLYEIMLWKIGRFPYCEKEENGKKVKKVLDENILSKFNKFIGIDSLDKEKSDDLVKLIQIGGIKLPMLSTILFFLNPGVFQIIDVRANRIVFYGTDKYNEKLLAPNTTDGNDDFNQQAVDYYKMYLEELRKFDKEKLAFETAGYVLYQVEKDLGIPVDISKKGKDFEEEYKEKCKEIRAHFGYKES